MSLKSPGIVKKAISLPTNNLPLLYPDSILALSPDLHLALKPRARRSPRFVLLGSDKVVDTKCMRFVEGLNEREVGLCGVVDVDC